MASRNFFTMKKLTLVVLLLTRPAAPAHWHDDAARVRWYAAHHAELASAQPNDASGCLLPPDNVAVAAEHYRRQHPWSGGEYRLSRGTHLPRNWEDRLEPLPVLVDRRLIALPHGLRRDLLDGNIVIYDVDRETIVDVMLLRDWDGSAQ